jgi:hypothetical protein
LSIEKKTNNQLQKMNPQDVISVSAEQVKGAVMAGIKSGPAIAATIGVMLAYGIVMGMARRSEQVQKAFANPYIEPFINVLPLSVLAAAVSTFVFDRFLLSARMNTVSSKMLWRTILFGIVFVVVLYMTNLVSGRLEAYSQFSGLSLEQNGISQECLSKCQMEIASKMKENGVPLPAKSPVTIADGTGTEPVVSASPVVESEVKAAPVMAAAQ